MRSIIDLTGQRFGKANGKSKLPTFNSWQSMHARCYSPKHQAFKWYGARGIVVCPQWHKSNPKGFDNFLKDMGERPKGLTIDRINPNGHYSPTNCRWATWQQQRQNRRTK